MRGIVRFAGYVPYRRLERSSVSQFFGSGGGSTGAPPPDGPGLGTRAVASHDEDTTTMAVEALRLALAGSAQPGCNIESLWFATATPAYLDKTNAAAIHAATGLPSRTGAFDFGGSLRSGTGALLAALKIGGRGDGDGAGSRGRPGSETAGGWPGAGGSDLAVVMSDLRDGLPTSADESSGGDGAAAFIVGDGGGEAPILAAYLGGASLTEEFLDRWRLPGERRSRTWEERFGETRYLQLGHETWQAGLAATSLAATEISRVVVTGMHSRATSGLVKKLGVPAEAFPDDLAATIGQAGCAHPGIALVSALEKASPGEVIGLVHLADGADAMFFRATEAIASWTPARSLTSQIASGAKVTYGKFLAWRGMVSPEPPRRPEPSRVSSTAAWRSNEWKYGFTGSADRSSAAVHLPPARVSMTGGAVDEMIPVTLRDTRGTVATFTVDRLAYSPSPPIVFAVVDFDGGGRFPLELTDCEAGEVAIGDRVEMTFRRLYSADSIHDYFWKARPVRDSEVSCPPVPAGGQE